MVISWTVSMYNDISLLTSVSVAYNSEYRLYGYKSG